jgi:aminoglycoside/choline kinase family phosphotransferase
MLMHALPERPEIVPPGLRDPGSVIPFVAISDYLGRHGIPVPEIYAVETDERWVLLEDLGDLHVRDLDEPSRSERLEEAVRLLARVHELPPEDELPFRREFDATWIRFELQTFANDGLPSRAPRAALEAELERLVDAVSQLPRRLCLRDYQSENLMIDATGRLRVIDYQDALLAPVELDLAALLFDSYLDIAAPERERLLDAYARSRGEPLNPTALSLLVVQRKCKDFGRFRYMMKREGEARWKLPRERARAAVLGALPGLPAGFEELAQLLSDTLNEAKP